MNRVANVVAASLLAVTVASAAPAAAMPTAEPGEAPITAVKSKARSATGAEENGLGSKIKKVALSQVGAPYSYGGTTPAGFDCSGFTSWVYSHFGVTLPHSSSAQYSLGGSGDFISIASIADLQVGDLVVHGDSGGIQHVGIYVGNNEFVSATSSAGVQVRSLFDSYWGPMWVGGVRLAR
jgi:cell wall-associated NlpC family hydrolase